MESEDQMSDSGFPSSRLIVLGIHSVKVKQKKKNSTFKFNSWSWRSPACNFKSHCWAAYHLHKQVVSSALARSPSQLRIHRGNANGHAGVNSALTHLLTALPWMSSWPWKTVHLQFPHQFYAQVIDFKLESEYPELQTRKQFGSLPKIKSFHPLRK